MKQIASGAEAIILKTESGVIKKRIPKSYRISFIDNKLRKSRAKKELKVLTKLKNHGLNVPIGKSAGMYDIELEYIDGIKVRDCLFQNLDFLSKEIGIFVAKMHDLDLIHGDLTTSNMIYSNNKLYFIDFGLSQTTSKVEDKAVDLHLLKHALESYHHDCCDLSFKLILEEYCKICSNSSLVIERLNIVELRGRNKT